MSILRGVAEGDSVRYAFPRPEPLKTEHQAFYNAIRKISSDVGIVTMAEAVRVVEVAEAVIESAKVTRI
jgi:predicted dehydrogenase